jgi:hypothetical protein
MMAMLGGMKVAEGIVRFCPLTALFERGQDMVRHQGGNRENDEPVEEMQPYNPS